MLALQHAVPDGNHTALVLALRYEKPVSTHIKGSCQHMYFAVDIRAIPRNDSQQL